MSPLKIEILLRLHSHQCPFDGYTHEQRYSPAMVQAFADFRRQGLIYPEVSIRTCDTLSPRLTAKGKELVNRLRDVEPGERAPAEKAARQQVQLGVIEFHTAKNDALREQFYMVVDDLRAAGCIVDVWLMDIASVLKKHGYSMEIYRGEADKAAAADAAGQKGGAA